jgi:hypothetical protein
MFVFPAAFSQSINKKVPGPHPRPTWWVPAHVVEEKKGTVNHDASLTRKRMNHNFFVFFSKSDKVV